MALSKEIRETETSAHPRPPSSNTEESHKAVLRALDGTLGTLEGRTVADAFGDLAVSLRPPALP